MRFLLAICISIIVTTLTMPANSQEIHADLCRTVVQAVHQIIIIRDIYILSSNDKTKFADWVAYR